MKNFFRAVWEAGRLWYHRDASDMAAVVSYYSLFAVAPLLLLTITFTSFLYGTDFVIATLYQWGSILGADMLVLLHDAVQNLGALTSGFVLPVVGILFFSWMVIVLFNTFTKGLHHLWEIKHRGFKGWVHKSIRSASFVLVFELYLLCMIGINHLIKSLEDSTGIVGVYISGSLFFIFATTILFSLAYRILPWEGPAFRERLCGGFVASILLLLVKSLVALYITTTPMPGIFGAAGLILVLLIWVYVSACIIYYGAAFAYVLAGDI